MNRLATIGAAVVLGVLTASSAHAATYNQGFETDIAGWDVSGADPTRVSSGTHGVTSASGGYHAEVGPSGSIGNWGGYNSSLDGGTVFNPYTTSVDIFLDVGTTAANDTRFDFSSAINKSGGSFLRDFAFNVGFYTSATTGLGSGSDRFVIAAGNNTGRANSYPADPGHNPIAITSTGWYTFQSEFTDNLGFLSVLMSIIDSSNSVIQSWTLNTADAIADVGGNRYGWFLNNEFSTVAFDNATLSSVSAVPLPAALPLFASGLLGLGLVGWRRKRKTT
jgi:hypothetical protein